MSERQAMRSKEAVQQDAIEKRQMLTEAYHDRLVEALQFIVDAYGVGSTPERFAAAIEDEMLANRALLAEIEEASR